MTEEQVSLKSLLVPSLETEIEFPGMDEFKVKLCHISRTEKAKLVKQSTVTKYVNHQPVTELDDSKFLKAFSKATIKDWSGLKYKYLMQLVATNIKDNDLEDCLPFSIDNAEILLESSETFDAWVVDTVKELANFTKGKLDK